MKTAIVIVNWKRADLLLKALDSMNSRPEWCNILIVDQEPPGDNGEAVSAYLRDGDTYLPLESNVGCPSALNIGFKQAIAEGAEFLIRCDNDTEVTEGCIERVVNASIKTGGIVGPMTNSGNNMHCPEPLKIYCSTIVDITSLTGFFTCIPKHIYEDVGGFREVTDKGEPLMIYCEDTAFCLDAVEKGYQCYLEKWAYCYHEHRGSNDLHDFEANSKKAAEFFRREYLEKGKA